MNMSKSFKELLIKSLIFVSLFIIFSIIIGTKLYQYSLLDKWKIEIYGRIGYIILFSLLGFILMYKDKLMKLKSFAFEIKDALIIVLSFIFLSLFYLFQINAYKFEISIFNMLLVHLLGISIFISLALGVFGIKFTKNFILVFKKELGYFFLFATIVYFAMNFVLGLWPYLSFIVLKLVYFVLSFMGTVKILGTDILIYEGFAVKVAEACSGIYSIFLFLAIYIFAIFLDYKKLNLKKVLILFIPALIGAFLVNVLRVLVLMLVGAHMSQDIALGLYHSYTGMIFFLIYFAIFWSLSYKWLCK